MANEFTKFRKGKVHSVFEEIGYNYRHVVSGRISVPMYTDYHAEEGGKGCVCWPLGLFAVLDICRWVSLQCRYYRLSR